MTDYIKLQSRCQRGEASLAGANNLLAECHAALGRLIAENERLKTLRSTTERDLAQELEVWRHGPSCRNCGDTGDVHDIVGEWRGQCDCNAAKLIDVAAERDQLKAENEALRRERDARHPFKPFHDPAIGFTGCVICGVYTDHGGLPCPKTRATADAAMGKGEQS
ncbi:hypothetical protein [Pseudomonas reactans]|uniref:hypothetical protein n=1 Tax=Pseudomonas reactans TaxID=117680 RepID=UPI0021168BA8|nr:hypothetical protein [Pseudomonas reactans]